MSASALISAAELADRIDDIEWLIIDCRFDLLHPAAGAAAYLEGHIPGAVYAHLERDLSRPVTTDSGRHPLPERTPSNFQGTPNQRMLITSAELSTQLGNDRHCLIDVRKTERYAGASEPIDPIAGHIPGACNLPYQSNLDSDGCYLDAQILRKLYRPLLEGRPATCCSLMCGSGVTSCHSLIALEIARMPGAKLYAEFWSEWIRDPDRPIAKDH